MKIKVDYSLAEETFNFISNREYLDRAQCDLFFKRQILQDGLKAMLRFYHIAIDEYADVFYRALNQLAFETESETLKMMYGNLKRIRGMEDVIERKLDYIKGYEFNCIGQKLSETLPKNTELDIEIHFVFDGINGGSIVGENTMLINTMFWPSKEEHQKLIEGILLHEYHHIGLKYWIKKYHESNNMYQDDVHQIGLHLSEALMGEGAATYLFNEGDDLYPLLIESHGEEFASQYKAAMNSRAHKIEGLIGELENDLLKVISSKELTDELKSLVGKYSLDSSGNEPRDKTIGFHMCSVIDSELGRSRLIDGFQKPYEFLKAYNDAAKSSASVVFSEAFIHQWEQWIENV